MGLWDQVTRILALEPWQEPTVQTRAIDSFVDHPGLTEQLLRVQGLEPRPWRVAGIREAMGVPAIFRAVTLISNITGSMTLRAFRNGTELSDTERPRIIVRPNPFTTAREFFRMTAYCMATRGEAWWWVAARDTDGVALSVMPVNPAEVGVTENARDLRYPIIEWRGKRMPNADMIHIPFMMEPGSLRGVGPLQMCGAAISVAVEAQEWAANFFATGGHPSILIKSALSLEEDEAGALKSQWIESDSNTPKVVDPTIESVEEIGTNTQGAQMLEARAHQNSDAARMFGIPGSLLEAAVSGQSLTYQNVSDEFDKFVRACLLPDYLEPIEQAMGDLLTRSTVSKFNVEALLRANTKTRWEVYELMTKVIGVEAAAQIASEREGFVAGDIENAPIPLAPPQAVPASLPIQLRTDAVRCTGTRLLRGHLAPCGKMLGELAPGSSVTCPRCKKVTVQAAAKPADPRRTVSRFEYDAEGRMTGLIEEAIGA